MGSLISAAQLERVSAHVDDAVAKGATVLAGGRARPDLGPYFYEPTVLAGVTEEMALCREETFGPVVSVRAVRDVDEAVALANDSDFGLNASVWSRDVDGARRVAARIRTGTVSINETYARGLGRDPRADGRREGLRARPSARPRRHPQVHRAADRCGATAARVRARRRRCPGTPGPAASRSSLRALKAGSAGR